jgi:hypothetical protein
MSSSVSVPFKTMVFKELLCFKNKVSFMLDLNSGNLGRRTETYIPIDRKTDRHTQKHRDLHTDRHRLTRSLLLNCYKNYASTFISNKNITHFMSNKYIMQVCRYFRNKKMHLVVSKSVHFNSNQVFVFNVFSLRQQVSLK